ncbi:hypothetical protein ACF3DV_23945 [Chlorogloeopsis fritschii PCC 9212]|uniref:hypothetical protein n=1 Tax=Chlorogloeopsis fritschii TaxID=1124 RepID=UPI0003659E08|nr:hypothetical protein [Chlorogloeopsis fritschii]
MAALFLVVWLAQIVSAIGYGTPPDTSSVLVLDLAFFLPLLAIGAVLFLREQPLGDLLVPVILIHMGTLGTSVFLGGLLSPLFGQPLDLFMIVLFAVVSLGGLAFAFITLSRFGQLHAPRY